MKKLSKYIYIYYYYQILSSIKREEFDYSRLPAIYNSIDFNEFKNGKWDRNFSEVENQIWRFIEVFNIKYIKGIRIFLG